VLLVSLFFLFVYLFGAYAYGVATLYGLREAGPIWGTARGELSPRMQRQLDRAGLALFALSTAWFVINLLIEFRNFTGYTREGWLDIASFIVYAFPPVIMHTVFLESHHDDETPPPAWAKPALIAMYVISPLIGVYVIAAIFEKVPPPESFGLLIGGSIGALFTVASIYSSALMLRKKRTPRTPDQARLRTVMIAMFATLSVVFITLMFMRDQQLLGFILQRVAKSSPIYFMIASIYFENRFEFYDLVVKRALLLMLSAVTLAVFLLVALPWMEALPAGNVRPWLFALALTPLAMIMPHVLSRTERWLDRMWFDREFTTVEAVKHVLSAMQPATDEQALIEAAEARLSEIFGAKIVVLVGSRAIFEPSVEVEVKLTSPVTGGIVRIAVLKGDHSRHLLSEDLTLLRSLGGVFGFMLENIRLQRKRVEQEQLAQELRLQSSKSELKALRAQINPHFLFNALNAIASLIHTDPGRADEAVEQLAEVFRYTLRRSDSEWAPLDQELTFARAYLDVEQARFGQRLTATIDSDHLPPAPMIPSMLLQTLLENAVKHGVSQQRGPGRIDVIVRSESDLITIEVRNTGPAQSSRSTPSDGEGFGLRSINERLAGHFGERASFTLTRDEGREQTIARIVMPRVRIAP